MQNNITVSKLVDECVISKNPVTKILDLGQHAYADTFIRPDQLNLSEPVFPLQVYLNANSGSIQLGYVSSATDRYNLYSYSYTSSNSQTARNHWDKYAQTIQGRGHIGLVVEIGSNDGYLVSQFDHAVGVDSSAEMCALSQARGVETINTLFDDVTADAIKNKHGTASVIIANNVFNHANDPVSFARGVAELLDHDGVFVFELPYWGDTVSSGKFDQIYHEHVSYFTVKSSWNLLQAAGMTMTDFEHVDYHGGSIRVSAQLGKLSMSEKIQQAIARETVDGLFSVARYQLMQQQMIQQRDTWLKNFYQLREQSPDAVIIGVGAAAKANTWLTWHGLNHSALHCVTDSSPHKQGKYTPLSRIPIHGDEEFAKHAEPIALILSWNISNGLKQALININPNIRFISQ